MNLLNQSNPSPEFASCYCINPNCFSRQNPAHLRSCQACGNSLFVNDRYRLVAPLRSLDEPASNAEIFELEDWGIRATDFGKPKVIKVLKPTNDPTLIRLFEQEARILTWLRHPGIPQVEPDGYFTFTLKNSSKQLHCLVMEKIEGLNLQQWLTQNDSISQELALDWLRQLTEILDVVHQKTLFHRDLKPSNIMLRTPSQSPSSQEKARRGQLVLIDFGSAREITSTYVDCWNGNDVTRVISSGYTAPEQRQGQGMPKSDFFALGRTFVHLLTGKHPDHLKITETDELIWRDSAPQISPPLADLIDDLMAPLSADRRPKNPQVLLQRLEQIQFPNAALEMPAIGNRRLLTINQAVRLLNSGKVKSGFAALLFLGLISFRLVAPQLAVALNDLASDNYQEGHLNSAQRMSSLALLLNPHLGESRYIQALIAERRQDFALARTLYEMAKLSVPDKVLNNLGRLDILEGKYTVAVSQIQSGLQQVTDVPVKSAMHKNMGWALLGLGDPKQAKSHLEQAIALNSSSASPHCLLAQVLEAEGNMADALTQWKACMRAALNDDQRLPEVEIWLAQAQQRLELQDNQALSKK